MSLSELSERLDSNPQSLVGKSYTGLVQAMPYDKELFVLVGDFIVTMGFDRIIREVIER